MEKTPQELKEFYEINILPWINSYDSNPAVAKKSLETIRNEISNFDINDVVELLKLSLEEIDLIPSENNQKRYKILANLIGIFDIVKPFNTLSKKPSLPSEDLFSLFVAYVRQNVEFHLALMESFLSQFPKNTTIPLSVASSLFESGEVNFQKIIDYIKNTEVIDELTKETLLNKIIDEQVKKAIRNFDRPSIQKLNKYEPYFGNAIKDLNKKDAQWYNDLITVEDPEYVKKYLSEFMSKSEPVFGETSYEGGLLAIAEVAHRKIVKPQEERYVVNPTVIKHSDFEKYLTLLKNKTPPSRERFIITGGHWVSGDIKIDANGTAKILLIDPLGKFDYQTPEHIANIAKIFPDAEIFFDNTQRQTDYVGCMVFALDDVRHLFTIENYLPKKEGSSDLFDFLEHHRNLKHTITTNEKKKITVQFTQLPVAFMRTMTTSVLYKDKEIIKDKKRPEDVEFKKAVLPNRLEEDLAMPMNKKKQTGQEFLTELQNHGFRNKAGVKTIQNVRLAEKLASMSTHIYDMLTSLPKEDIEAAKQKFTIKAFEERIEAQKQQNVSQPMERSSFVHEKVQSPIYPENNHPKKSETFLPALEQQMKKDKKGHGKREDPTKIKPHT